MLSGGVDSSVAAVQLLKQGYEVHAVFMQCWSEEQLIKLGLDPQDYACAWDEDAKDAEWIAKKLNISFEVWDLREHYFEHVVQYMIHEYSMGKTPNPDVMCNSFIKFGIFAKKALDEGADFVATGHYARKIWSEKHNQFLIARALDANKDQSYFLARINPTLINRSLFPIGEFTSKIEVRNVAHENNLITASKPDSQGICFIGDTPLRAILLKTLGQKPGSVVDFKTNKAVGLHSGAFLFTIGQRHGLGLSGGPWYVHSINIHTNTVFVVHDSQSKAIESRELQANNAVWFVDHLTLLDTVQAQIRYRQKAEMATITCSPTDFHITFSSPTRAVAPGQIAAIYQDDLLIGSGIIIQ